MPNTEKFPIDRIEEIQLRPEDFKLIERIPITLEQLDCPVELSKPVGDEQVLIILDTETTGLEFDQDRVIEVGLVKALYSPSSKSLTSIVGVLSGCYEDPGKSIPEFITDLTGITDEMVKGQQFDDQEIASWFSQDPLVVAHNAKFDRKFFDRRFPSLSNMRWACSAFDVKWGELNRRSRKLEDLVLKEGWFYEGHRASIDCLAVAWLFHIRPDAFGQLIDRSAQDQIVVKAIGAPFDIKDNLKQKGYRWNNGNAGSPKHWWIEICETELAAEKQFLNELYDAGSHAEFETIDIRNRFK